MAQIFEGGADLFDALAYGAKPHPGTQQFLSNQVNQFSANLTEAGARFVESAREVYERISNSQALRLAKAAGRRIRGIWQSDEIRALRDIGELQQAPITMQRWVMAQPDLRKLYHSQRCDGYSDTYIDMHPGVRGESHYDYRRVMDGVVVFDDEEDPESNYRIKWYHEDLLPEDNELSSEEKVDIIATWDFIAHSLISGKDDPTSRHNAEL